MDLIGHHQIAQNFDRMMRAGKIPHALIFSGQESIGKSLFARSMAFSLLTGQKNFTSKIDVMDPNWQQMKAGVHPDFMDLSADHYALTEGRLEFKAEDVHKVTTFFHNHRVMSLWRVVIIDSIANVSIRNAHALLKTIEEPPANTLIIIIAHNIEEVLPTIRSRAQVIHFENLSIAETQQILKQQPIQIDKLGLINKTAELEISLKNLMILIDNANDQFIDNFIQAINAIPLGQPHHYINLWDSFGKENGKLTTAQKYNLTFEILMKWVTSKIIDGGQTYQSYQYSHKIIIDYWLDASQQWSNAQIYHLDKKVTLTIIVNRFALMFGAKS